MREEGHGGLSGHLDFSGGPEEYPEAPQSWEALWDPANEGRLGLLALASNSFLLEITATTFFDRPQYFGARRSIFTGVRVNF